MHVFWWRFCVLVVTVVAFCSQLPIHLTVYIPGIMYSICVTCHVCHVYNHKFCFSSLKLFNLFGNNRFLNSTINECSVYYYTPN